MMSTQRQTQVIDEVDSEYNEAESDCCWNQRDTVPKSNLQDLRTSQFDISHSHPVLPKNDGPMEEFDE